MCNQSKRRITKKGIVKVENQGNNTLIRNNMSPEQAKQRSEQFAKQYGLRKQQIDRRIKMLHRKKECDPFQLLSFFADNFLMHFKENGIRLKVIALPTTMMDLSEGQKWVLDMVNHILIEVLRTIAEQECETICKWQDEGIEAAKANGKKLGSPALTFPTNQDKVYTSWKSGEITAKIAREMTDTKRTSFYKLVGMMEEE